MVNVWGYSLTSVIIVSLVSFIGIFTIAIRQDTLKKFLIYFVSFSAGALFGDVFIHLLPEIIEDYDFGLKISLYIIFGVIFSFIVEKIIHYKHHHKGYIEIYRHHHPKEISPFARMNILGDALHNFIDGLIIGGSYLIGIRAGVATTLAVILHEIPQEVGDFGVLLKGGFSRAKALLINFITALTAIAGVIISLLLDSYITNATVFLIAFSAGTFIYIAGSNLIPELHKDIEFNVSAFQTITFILGIGIMLILKFFEV